jgi:Ni,Fe-hydrogenase maturation factor
MSINSHPLVIGLGNEYRSDDAVGHAIARQLKASEANGVEIKEGECGA